MKPVTFNVTEVCVCVCVAEEMDGLLQSYISLTGELVKHGNPSEGQMRIKAP